MQLKMKCSKNLVRPRPEFSRLLGSWNIGQMLKFVRMNEFTGLREGFQMKETILITLAGAMATLCLCRPAASKRCVQEGRLEPGSTGENGDASCAQKRFLGVRSGYAGPDRNW